MKYYEIVKLMREYVKTRGGENIYNQLSVLINSAKVAEMGETGLLGFTFLHVAISLPYMKFKKEPELAMSLSLNLYNLVMQRCKTLNNPLLTKILLLKIGKDNFTMLHTLMRTGNSEVAPLYFAELQTALDGYIIDINDCREIFTPINSEGYTSLQQGIISGDKVNLQEYLTFADKNKLFSDDEYTKLFLSRNNHDNTLLHSLGRKGNIRLNILLYNFINTALSQTKGLPKVGFSNFILRENSENDTYLHLALVTAGFDLFYIHLHMLMTFLKLNIISLDVYKKVLIGNNSQGRSPLVCAIKGSLKTFELYLAAVEQDYLQGTISKSDYRYFLKGAVQIHKMTEGYANCFLEYAGRAYEKSVLNKTEYEFICDRFKPKTSDELPQTAQNSSGHPNNGAARKTVMKNK